MSVKSERVQCDEVGSFVGSKEKNISIEKVRRWLWRWDSKLVISWLLGDRDVYAATEFLKDIAARV